MEQQCIHRTCNAAMLELDGGTLTYAEFRRLCLVPNRPAIIRNACTCGGRMSFDLAAVLDRLCPQALCDAVGPNAPVPVYPTLVTSSSSKVSKQHSTLSLPPAEKEVPSACVQHGASGDDTGKSPDYTDGCCETVPLSAVLHSWRHLNTNFFTSTSKAQTGFADACVYYLKDWHLQEALEAATAASSSATAEAEAGRAHRVHGAALYRVPHFLGADWMDPFCRWTQKKESALHDGDGAGASPHVGFGGSRSDYRFAYIGPVGSWTPLHCDVFGTYSWSFNVCGDKLWFFPTPASNEHLHAHLPPLFPLPPDLRVVTGIEVEAVTQHPGDLVFVPARFFHQVHNITGEEFPLPACLADAGADGEAASTSSPLPVVGPLTMALNHNWCNVFNIECMTRAFLDDAQRLVSHLSVDDVKVICDTDDVSVWRSYVDQMLHSGTNWSYASMTSFLAFCLRRVEASDAEMVTNADEREMAESLLRRLLSDVTSSHARLFAA